MSGFVRYRLTEVAAIGQGGGFHGVEGLEQVIHGDFAVALDRAALAQRRQCAVDGLVHHMPVAGGTGLDAGFGFIPGGFQVLDPGFRRRQVIFLDPPGDVGGNAAER